MELKAVEFPKAPKKWKQVRKVLQRADNEVASDPWLKIPFAYKRPINQDLPLLL